MPHVLITWGGGPHAGTEAQACRAHHPGAHRGWPGETREHPLTFVGVPPTDYAEEGVIVADQKRSP